MKIVHLDECHSTQDYLKNQLNEGLLTSPALVSTRVQTGGKGRREKSWHQFEGALAFSFITKAFNPLTFSPLAVGVVLCETFKEFGVSLKLKWPNDILNTNGLKVGGILSQVYDSEFIICGVGINLFPSEHKGFDFPHGFIFEISDKFDRNDFFRQFMVKIEDRKKDFKELWSSYCFHQNKKVSIVDEEHSVQGIFKGLGESGEALVKNDSEGLQQVFTGSLRFLEDGNKSSN